MQLYIECLLLAVAGVGETNSCPNPLRGKKQGNAGCARDTSYLLPDPSPLPCTSPRVLNLISSTQP